MITAGSDRGWREATGRFSARAPRRRRRSWAGSGASAEGPGAGPAILSLMLEHPHIGDRRLAPPGRVGLFSVLPLVIGSSCATGLPELPPMPEREQASFEEPRVEWRTRKDEQTDRVTRTWFVLVYPDGRVERHGVEREFHPEGVLAAEREYQHGQPSGSWKTWWPSGAMRSNYHYLESRSTTMRFWHETGRLSAEGPAVEGVREGEWSFWHEDGSVRQRGEYRNGLREGAWTVHHPGGAVRSRGTFAGDRRVGTWEHFPDTRSPVDEPGSGDQLEPQ